MHSTEKKAKKVDVTFIYKQANNKNSIEIYSSKPIARHTSKKLLSLSFPGYPPVDKQKVDNSHLLKEDNIFRQQITLVTKQFFENVRTVQKFTLSTLDFKKTFLFSHQQKLKKIQFHIGKNLCVNPYAIYQFDDFMCANFEKFKQEKDSFLRKDESFSYFFENLLAQTFKNSTNLMVNIIKKTKTTFTIHFQICLIVYYISCPRVFSFLLLIWNFFLIQTPIKIISRFIGKTRIGKNIARSEMDKVDNLSWFSRKIVETGLFFNGAFRSLNMLAV